MLDNIYQESTETSGAYLRIALQHISRHNLPYNPITYAVWYEYASGRNPSLQTDIENQVKRRQTISYEKMVTLFRKHLAENQMILAERKTRELQSVLGELTSHLVTSEDQINSQGTTLSHFVHELSASTSLDDVTKIARQIEQETKAVVESGRFITERVKTTTNEIKNLRQELEGIKQDARTDMLTGLLNRRGFDEAVFDTMENRNGNALSIVLFDIDYFKQINDTHGHLIGDNVLKLLSRLIQDHIKGKDIAARFGGEEFILLLPETRLTGAFALAEQIRTKLGSMRWMTKNSGKSIGTITISAGVAQFRTEEPIEKTIQRADNALYLAKNNGRNRCATEQDLV